MPETTPSLTRAETAFQLTLHHEGAHMSACMMFDIPFDLAVVTTGFWSGLRGGVHITEDADPLKIENEIIVYFVGLAAEARWLTLHPGYGEVRESNGASDTAEARKLIRKYRRQICSENRLLRKSGLFVENRWDHITMLARNLGERRRLTARQAARAR